MNDRLRMTLMTLFLAGLLLIGCTASGNEPAASDANEAPVAGNSTNQPADDEPVGIANPAATYCEEQGGTSELRADESGNPIGICVFEDGSACEEWAFFRGECAPGDTQLFETLWVLQSIGGQAPLPDTTPTLRISGDWGINGSTGCNSFFGSVTVEEGVWTVGPVGQTEMWCEERMDQETAVIAALQAATGHALAANQLIIRSPEGDLVYAPAQDTALEGTRWVLSGLTDLEKQAVISTWVDADVFLQFVDGQVSGNAGCNLLSGSYEADGASLALSPLAMTRRACEEERTQREAEVAKMLEQVTGYAIELDTLTLLDADGNTLATFMANGPAAE